MHLKGIRKDEKTYFLPSKVHIYIKGKTETRNNGFCNIPKKIKIQVWLSGGLMS